MINKTKIILPSDDDEIKLMLSKACDLYNKAQKSTKPFYTKFLSPLEAAIVANRFPKNELELKLFGGYDDAERKVCAFYTFEEDLSFPLCTLHIKLKSKNTSLSHRDYLGSLLSMGLKREVIGDIVVQEGCAYVFCLEEIAHYITDGLLKVGGAGVTIEKAALSDDISIKREYQMLSSTVSSLRCDAVIASALNLARSKACELIGRGLVTHNYEQLKSVSSPIKNGDVLSARGYGKFKILTSGNLTKKGRIHIDICKYI
ncbi:MAG: hypothetical protein J6R68_03320 [Clostridia bacterium]|nr:hypothetical protein [Clostridia bacterium]